MNKSMHAIVEGRVQGVFFRAETQQQAIKLSLGGWVKNLEDGRVEVMASGSQENLSALQEWLQQGPSRARVDRLEVEFEEYQPFAGFEISYR